MPDQWNFDDLGDRRACVVPGCGAGGLRWEWPEIKRMAHHHAHEDTRRKAINEAAAKRLHNWRGGQT